MNRKKIVYRLFTLINTTFENISVGEHDLESPLTNWLEARHLLLLFFEVEKEFKINIIEENFEKTGFHTINEIADLVELSL